MPSAGLGKGVWQRFATKWAIVFALPSHCPSDLVRRLRRNATSMTHATASDGLPDLAHEAGFFSVFCDVPVSGLVSAKATRGRACRPIANPIPVSSGVGERSIESPGPSPRAGPVPHKTMCGQTLGRMAQFVANRCHTPSLRDRSRHRGFARLVRGHQVAQGPSVPGR